jgi:hypothetical protein
VLCCVDVALGLGGVEVLDQMVGQGGGGGFTAGGSLGCHQRLSWGRCSGCRLNDC